MDLYAQPYNLSRPVVNFDEWPSQLVDEVRAPLPPTPGHPERYACEYRRCGTCNLALFLQPLARWRHVAVTEGRTKADFASQMRELAEVHFPDAAVIRMVLDQLNTHTPAVLYDVFPPEEARRIRRRLEFHYPHAWQLAQHGRD